MTQRTIIVYLSVLLATVTALAVILGWLRYVDQAGPKAPVNLSIPAKPAPEVKHEAKAQTPIKAKTVKAYKPAIKKELKLPEHVQLDAAAVVIAASQVKPDDHSQTITSVLDVDTGEVETYVKRDPLPWLAWDKSGEAGIILELQNGEPAVRLEARQNLFQVKAVHFGGTGSVEQTLNGSNETKWSIGFGGWGHWD